MADTRAQLAEVDALIAASPDEPSLLQLREDLLQLIALEELEKSSESGSAPAAAATAENYSELQNNEQQQQQQGVQLHAQHVEESSEQQNYSSANYTAQSTFTDNIGTDGLAEAPDLGSFQPVEKSTHLKSTSTTSSTTQAASLKSGDDDADDNNNVEDTAAASAASTSEKKKKKKKKSDDKLLSSKFELPNHLIPLESDSDAQKQKKQRAAKALKSKFRSKQKEMEHTKRANDWKSFSTKASKKNKKLPKSSIFSTEEGVNAKVGVISGGGSGRTMTGYSEQGKHKFS
jgi:survival-of-motor-neuron-related-splicing factor 30